MAVDPTRRLTAALVETAGAPLESVRVLVEMLDKVTRMAHLAVGRAVETEREVEARRERQEAAEMSALEEFGKALDRAKARREGRREDDAETGEDGGAAESGSDYATASSGRSDVAEKGSSDGFD